MHMPLEGLSSERPMNGIKLATTGVTWGNPKTSISGRQWKGYEGNFYVEWAELALLLRVNCLSAVSAILYEGIAGGRGDSLKS